jgi:hypothetical protein
MHAADRGPGDTNLLPRILHRAKHNQLRMINGGTKLMDAVYIDNAVHAHILAVDQLRTQVGRGNSLRAAALRSAQGATDCCLVKYQRRGAMHALAAAALKHVHVHVRPQGCCLVYSSHALCRVPGALLCAAVVQAAAAPCAGKVYFIANGESTVKLLQGLIVSLDASGKLNAMIIVTSHCCGQPAGCTHGLLLQSPQEAFDGANVEACLCCFNVPNMCGVLG